MQDNHFLFSKTPYRVSLFGGGSDYPAYYKEHGGACIGGAINKYCYIGSRYLPPFFAHKHRIVYSQTEHPQSIDEIKHPSVREVLKHLNIEEGLEIHHYGDLPARSGLGTSSSFTVGLLNCLTSLQSKKLSKQELYLTSILIEQSKIKEAVGSQDQVMVTQGGFNYIKFNQCGKIECEKIIEEKRIQRLSENLMLFFTGVSRNSSENAEKIIKNIPSKVQTIKKMVSFAHDAKIIIENPSGNLDHIGEMLNEAWLLKKTLADTITTDFINDYYERALKAGAIGGKILGAGGGGFLLFYVPEESQNKVKMALSELLYIDFKFEFEGASLVKNLGREL
ncbi:MAG: D-glycero-alpha-D-manno-heptose-7-phosphate kinase [Bacteriovoracaceae bacterium]|jgi:D-glycero-alpha-D-manno-heptose-7-phosphate kinase